MTGTPADYAREYAELGRLIEHVATTSYAAAPLAPSDPRHHLHAQALVAALEQTETGVSEDAAAAALADILVSRCPRHPVTLEQTRVKLAWICRELDTFTTSALAPRPA